jgi:transcriptional regulator with XRE-family HTH domain
MYFQEIGNALRNARQAKGMTQATLAAVAGVSRTTVNQVENGVFPDLGAKKLLALLAAVGLDFALVPQRAAAGQRDYLKLACTSANVSYKEALTPDELASALLSGKAPPARRPQLRVVFDEVPDAVFEGLLAQVGAWSKPERIRRHADALAEQIGSRRSAQR